MQSSNQATGATRTYPVLYSKRQAPSGGRGKRKLNSSKGEMEGLLSISLETGIVTLKSSDDAMEEEVECDDEEQQEEEDSVTSSEEEEDDDDDGKTRKERQKLQRQKYMKNLLKKRKRSTNNRGNSKNKMKKNSVVYSGKHLEIVQRIQEKEKEQVADVARNGSSGYGLSENDVIVLPHWQCQITLDTTTMPISSNSNKTGVRSSLLGKKSALKPSLSSSFSKKMPVNQLKRGISTGLGTTGIKRNNILGTSSSSSILQQKKHPLKNRQGLGSLISSGIGVKSTVAMKKDTSTIITKSSSTAASYPQDIKPSITSSTIASSPLSSKTLPKKRSFTVLKQSSPILSSSKKITKLPSITTRNKNTEKLSNAPNPTTHFPGAIGSIQVPNSVKSILRPHQREGVVFLWNRLTGSIRPGHDPNSTSDASTMNSRSDGNHQGGVHPRGVILADEMGLGKTLMTITAIFALHRKNRTNRYIIVCPSSLVTNWSKEFDKWLGKASQPVRRPVQKGGEVGLQSMRSFVKVKPNLSEVLIISYELYRLNSKLLSQSKQIGLLVVDEGHRLKNTSGSQTLSALNSLSSEARLLITGTPIQNKLSEFHNVANFVCPGVLGDLNSFRRVYERPINAANNKSATREEKKQGRIMSRELDSITSTFMIRRLQKDILKSLLPKRHELLLFCRPSQLQCEMYRDLADDARRCISPIMSSGSSDTTADALTVLTKLRKLCSHPCLLDESTTATYSSLSTSNIDDVDCSGKLDLLESLLTSIRSKCPTDKVVIVSNFTSALTVIQRLVLKKNNWSYFQLDGSVQQSERQPMVDSFNRTSTEQSFAFLLSSKAGGCGLNLIRANRLIMFDPDWNPANDFQAMARIYRQGQEKQCFIYRFFTTGTVEEVIYQRQAQKSNLTFEAKKSSNRNRGFTKEELKDCFTLRENCTCDTKDKVGKTWKGYDGADSLKEDDCDDTPLLHVASHKSNILSFVHIVDENDEMRDSSIVPDFSDLDSDDEKVASSLMNDGDETKEDCSSSDEAEFEDTTDKEGHCSDSTEEAEFE